PFLLRHQMREYQHVGLDWLANLYENGLNGILADEMGLGKTIQTIALLGHLACEKGVWGPHLVVVPTSVMLNWECEFKKWLPAFKILTYYGSIAERMQKRVGWTKSNAFHVCITSYPLVLKDSAAFRRMRWCYLILDEAHNIKNFRTQRWQTLLTFSSERRLLLTGTPLQNNLMELWSLMYFLMPAAAGAGGGGADGDSTSNGPLPAGFATQMEFAEWFSQPVERLVESTTALVTGSGAGVGSEPAMTAEADSETRSAVARLHTVLRPYLLRRLKADVEKQMPGKFEHVLRCRLSKRQRFLYDDFMGRSQTKKFLASGNYLSVFYCLMQLRKVCNHPDLFEERPIVTGFAMGEGVVGADAEVGAAESAVRRLMNTPSRAGGETDEATAARAALAGVTHAERYQTLRGHALDVAARRATREAASPPSAPRRRAPWDVVCPTALVAAVRTPAERAEQLHDVITRFVFVTPPVIVRVIPDVSAAETLPVESGVEYLQQASARLTIAFPDKRLLQYDCGKLQMLDILLRKLKAGGHRALIFTQMTKMLDILEIFLNIHGHRYLRLDGATKVETRQVLMERFNQDKRILVFILSTRSGGVGMNLTGADTVIFYDSDWNPAMDAQAQDRAHRIGQTREVHIYRLICAHTIEENILRKANQKRMLDAVVIGEGGF
ncbi:SNF2 family N-terminal domain-containing protein, partial [Blyttiomyces helicus]